jgi:steroid 5-alpha reductase family enzyme
MDSNNRNPLLALPFIIVAAAGLASAGSWGGYIIYGIPLFALCIGLAFLIQWAAFIPAFAMKTELFYDLVGSVTYISVVTIALLLSPAVAPRDLLLAGVVWVWALRLGSFLFRRIQAKGSDRRFDDIKTSLSRFLLAWTVQGLWVSFTLAAALAAMTSRPKAELGVFALAGFLVWLLGFGIEVIADRQKNQFRADPENESRFINVGLWSWSRHPNYFGEIVLWIGVAIIALPTLRGWQWFTLISPLFVIFLLTRVSGVPILEARADEKWGGQEDYEAYKESTSVLVPMPPSKPA